MTTNNIMFKAVVLLQALIFTLAPIAFGSLAAPAEAGALNYAASMADDLVKIFIKSGARVGSSTLSTVEKHILNYGDDFIRAANSVGHDAVEIASRYSKKGIDLVNSKGSLAVQALSNYGDEAIIACTKYGDDMTSVMARTRSLPPAVLKSHGKELMLIEKTVPKGIEITAAAIAQGAGRNADSVIMAMGKYGRNILDYIQNNPVLFGEMLLGLAVYNVITDEKLFTTAVGGAVNLAGKGIEKAGDVVAKGIEKTIDPANGSGAPALIRSAGLMAILLIIVLAILSKLRVNFHQICAMFEKPQK